MDERYDLDAVERALKQGHVVVDGMPMLSRDHLGRREVNWRLEYAWRDLGESEEAWQRRYVLWYGVKGASFDAGWREIGQWMVYGYWIAAFGDSGLNPFVWVAGFWVLGKAMGDTGWWDLRVLRKFMRKEMIRCPIKSMRPLHWPDLPEDPQQPGK